MADATTSGPVDSATGTTTQEAAASAATTETKVDGASTGTESSKTVLGSEPAKPESETKPTEGGEKPKAEGEKAAEGTVDPAKFTLPEGFKADDAQMAAFAGIANELKLPQDQAQKLVDLHAGAMKAAADANAKYWSETQTKWQNEVKATFGPEPAKNPKIIAAGKVIDSLGEKPAAALREALNMSGMGNHPAVIGAFASLAERLTEGGTVVAPKPAGRAPATFGEALYGNPQT